MCYVKLAFYGKNSMFQYYQKELSLSKRITMHHIITSIYKAKVLIFKDLHKNEM